MCDGRIVKANARSGPEVVRTRGQTGLGQVWAGQAECPGDVLVQLSSRKLSIQV